MSVIKAVLLMLAILPMASAAYGQEADAKPPTAPRISAMKLEPVRPQTGDRLALKLDAAGGTQRAEIRWVVNGEEVGLSDAIEFPATVPLETNIKAGDKIEVTATPFNLEDEKGPEQVIRTVVRNAPPIMKLENQRIEGTVYKAELKASDLEGKPVTLTLKKGPPGMKVDSEGRITWKFEPGTKGKFDVQISGKDEDGAEAILSYTFRIRRSTEVK
jgi:hypothetical protein